MISGDSLTLSNGLRLCVDWLSWTLAEPCALEDAITMMGYKLSDFQKLPSGRNGYRSQFHHAVYPISVQYDGNVGMGIHIDVLGSAVPDLVAHFYQSKLVETPFDATGYETDTLDSVVFRDLLLCIKENGHITRLDLAIDDIGAHYYTLSDLHDIFMSGSYHSKFRKWKELIDHNRNKIAGWTIYQGSRNGEIMLRIYDKQLEQNENLLATGSAPLMSRWVRWELELRKTRAQQAADRIISGMSVSDVSVGILSNYLKIINRDNERTDRCTVTEKWECFIAGISKLTLYRPKEPRTLDNIKKWLFRQVAPSLATVVLSDGGSMDCIEQLLESGSMRFKGYQKELIEAETEM